MMTANATIILEYRALASVYVFAINPNFSVFLAQKLCNIYYTRKKTK